MLFSGQRGLDAEARYERIAGSGQQALVAVACANHLPQEAPARAAHPHSPQPLRKRLKAVAEIAAADSPALFRPTSSKNETR